MVKKTFTFDIDIKKARSTPPPELVEGDNGNEFAVTLTDNGVPVDLTDCRVLILFSQPNGRTAQQDNNGNGVTMDETAVNKFTVNVYTTSFSPGTNNCEIQVLSGDNYETLVTSAQFNFECRRSILNKDTIQSTDEYPILADLVRTVEGAVERLEPIERDEAARIAAEADRIAAETARVEAETAREQAEALRERAEEERIRAEETRDYNEDLRIAYEGIRNSAENDRKAAEQARESAEEARVRSWNNASATATTLEEGIPATAKAIKTESGIAFEFGLPRGKQGVKGDKGDRGDDFEIRGFYKTVEALRAGVSNPEPSMAYGVGTAPPYDIYVFDEVTLDWVNNGTIQGPRGERGYHYTPIVDSDGTLRWDNNGGLDNPAPVNVKGPEGVGIESIVPYFARSSLATPPNDGWDTVPPVTTAFYRYLFAFEVITYTDGTEAQTPVRIIGVHGSTGAKGDPGNDGAQLIVSESEPTTETYFWFNTSYVPNAGDPVATFILDEELDGDVSANVEGDDYGVQNATVNETPTENSYDFEVH